MWRRAGEELITHRQAGEQQTDAMRARLSSAQPGWREERPGWREMEEKERHTKRGGVGEGRESRGGDRNVMKKVKRCDFIELDEGRRKRNEQKEERGTSNLGRKCKEGQSDCVTI